MRKGRHGKISYNRVKNGRDRIISTWGYNTRAKNGAGERGETEVRSRQGGACLLVNLGAGW